MPSEFELIRRRFTYPTDHTDLGIGDDCALFRTQTNMQTVVSTDMLVEGTHFLPDAHPFDVGWKTAAVNISDIAAMGAAPRWIVLSMALPAAEDAWVDAFSQGFFECCTAFGVDWIGGDTTRGPRALNATVIGEIPTGQAICRNGGRAGDDLWISGQPGLAALGLQHLQKKITLHPDWVEPCLTALHRPQPRVKLGQALRNIASAMLDVSDGVLGDLGHLLESSRCGASLEEALIPFAAPLAACGDKALAREMLLSGGDDYELLFSASPAHREKIAQISASLELPLTMIGSLSHKAGSIWWVMEDGTTEQGVAKGYDHFTEGK